MAEFLGLAPCGPPSPPPQAAYAHRFKSAIRPLPPLTSSNVVPCLRLVPHPNTSRLGVLVRKVTPRGRRSFSRCSYQLCRRAGGGANGWRGADLRQPCRHRISFACTTDANAATRIAGFGCLRHRCSPPSFPPGDPRCSGADCVGVMTVHDFISMTL